MLSKKLQEAAGNGADAKLYVDDVFSTYLYTGNGSTQTINNGIDLAGKGGLVWSKARASAATDHWLVDTVRGNTKYLKTNLTDAETSNSFRVTAFNSNGYNLNGNAPNFPNGEIYVSWTFRKAPKFFDVVTFTAGSNPNRSISHNLGIAPGMIITKRIDGVNDWFSYHRSLGQSAFITLNQTNAANTYNQWWTATAPTASTFNVDETLLFNTGATYVAYLFAHDTDADGIIQCGSYTHSNTATIDVNLGFEPQFVLVKNATTAGTGWIMLDNMRGFAANNNIALFYANSAATEQVETGSNYLGLSQTGFRSTPSMGGFAFNAGDTVIYMAIRRPNKPPTSGTQVFSPVYEGSTTPAVQTPFVVDMGISKRKDLEQDVRIGSRLQGKVKMWANLTNAESADANYTWDYQNGYKTNVGELTGYNINWTFKRAPGFFDEVCYTGNGVRGRQIAHNLGVAPELMLVKDRSVGRTWLATYVAAPYGLELNTTAASDGNSIYYWTTNDINFTAPTSSILTLGNQSGNNGATETYVAYLFATLAGISKVGSYTGNGSSQNIECGFAAGARFVLIKCTSAVGDWYVWDTVRGIVSENDTHLSLNTSAAEVTTDDSVDPYSAGFAVNQVAATNINVASATYIFLAIA